MICAMEWQRNLMLKLLMYIKYELKAPQKARKLYNKNKTVMKNVNEAYKEVYGDYPKCGCRNFARFKEDYQRQNQLIFSAVRSYQKQHIHDLETYKKCHKILDELYPAAYS